MFRFATDCSFHSAATACCNASISSQMSGVELCAADTVILPYRSGVFDAAISIAVLHHLSSHQRRLAALTEMLRILRVGGKLLVYV
jgi:ubiquinone/menaquinone biosynthesis C-methylase UbiE